MNPEFYRQLREPFMRSEIEWRVGSQGVSNGKPWAMAFAYVTNRAIMDRLDEVFGPMGWQDEYVQWKEKSQLCCIRVKDEETGEWISKWDGADDTHMEATKGGLSDAMKRAAVKWGIGRYLYKLDATFCECSTDRPKVKDGWHQSKIKPDNYNKLDKPLTYYWKEPGLPSWALPRGKE